MQLENLKYIMLLDTLLAGVCKAANPRNHLFCLLVMGNPPRAQIWKTELASTVLFRRFPHIPHIHYLNY